MSRLFTDGAFLEQIEQQFEGEPRLSFHVTMQFVPGWLIPRDPDTGRAPKWTFPKALMFAIWKTIQAFRFLRGTPFDPFGRTAHRKMESQLIVDYEKTLEELLEGLDRETLPIAVEIASLPELIRGYDTVKERHLEEARSKQRELLDLFRRRA